METKALIRDYGGTIVIAVVVALLIRVFLIEAYRIPSSAMRPTLEPGDTIFVKKWPFEFSPRLPRRGEVVVFSIEEETNRDYIKRVVGLAGDTVEVRDGHLLVNQASTEVPGSARNNCAEERTSDGVVYPVCFEHPSVEDFSATRVPTGSVFLLGDLRTKTPRERGSDQPVKSWGIFPVTALKGSALWIWLSVQPHPSTSGGFPNLRFDRMFRRIQ